jgi:hypothetical protein
MRRLQLGGLFFASYFLAEGRRAKTEAGIAAKSRNKAQKSEEKSHAKGEGNVIGDW